MNKDIPKISVIMGIYNCAPTLREALDSLYAQTFQDFQIILCDDGSSDNTLAIAEEYAKRHDNIILLRNERNLGLNATLNKCLAKVNTPLVARMDGDDISLPERFAVQVKFLDEHPEFAFVSTAMICFDENGDFKTLANEEGSPTKFSFVKKTPFYHAPVMVRKEAYLAVDGYSVSKKLLRVEDYHLWFKMYAAGFRGFNIKNAYYKMRDDRNALNRRTWLNRRNEFHVKIIGYRMLNLPLYVYPAAIIPIIKYFIPQRIYRILHRH